MDDSRSPARGGSRQFYVLTRPQRLFVICTAVFIAALVIAEATASKFFTALELPFSINIFGIDFDSVIMTAGVIAFPLTFFVMDLLNEYYGKTRDPLRDLPGRRDHNL